jgi:predicted transcriptional regulator
VYHSFKRNAPGERGTALKYRENGLSKAELARQLGISRRSLYRYIWDGPPRLIALAILGLLYEDRMGGLLEELSEPKEEMTREPKGGKGTP